MDLLMEALRKQLEFMIDDEENDFDSMHQFDSETFVVENESGERFTITATAAD